MMTNQSTSSDDVSFDPNDCSDDGSATVASEGLYTEGSLSSHESLCLGQEKNNDCFHQSINRKPDRGYTPHQARICDRDAQSSIADNNNTVVTATKENNEPTYLSSITVTNSSGSSSAKSQFSEKFTKQGTSCAEKDEYTSSRCTTERFFIVKSTYPKFSKYDISDPEIAECERRSKTIHEIVHPITGFDSEFQADHEARKVRNSHEFFQGEWACAPLGDNSEDSQFDEENFVFNSYDDPPWDSDMLENYDRDEDVIIDIMTLKQYHQKLEEQADDVEYIKEMDKIYKFDEVLQIFECKLRVRDSGCSAYYSYPAKQQWDVAAEMEVEESFNWHRDNLRKMRPDIANVKSFMFKGRQHGVFGWLLETCHHFDYKNDSVEVTPDEMQHCALFRHLQACKGLDELFFQLDTDLSGQAVPRQTTPSTHYVSKPFIQKIVYAAPQLDQLRVLSFGPSITLQPSALNAISKSLPSLERLDISFALSMEFAPTHGDEMNKFYPYENPLLSCVNELVKLNRLDLGFEMVDFHYIDSSGQQRKTRQSRLTCLLSEVALQEIRESMHDSGGVVTETPTTKPPSWNVEESEGRMRALREMIKDRQLDDDIREAAIEKYRELEAFLEETTNEPNELHRSRIDLLLEASGVCNAIDEALSNEQPPPAKDILLVLERKSLDTILSDNEAFDNLETDPQLNKVAKENQPSKSHKRNSKIVDVDDLVSTKRVCM